MLQKIHFTIVVLAIFTLDASAEGFTLHSKDLQGQISNKQVLNGFGCKGENVSPKLTWENAPKGTQSFAISIHDKDAKTQSGWWHWLVYDIPKNSSSLSMGTKSNPSSLKKIIQAQNDFSQHTFSGFCPPKDETHQYITTVYALNIAHLDIKSTSTPAFTSYMIEQHSIQKSSIVSYYNRSHNAQ